jgi:radical SAM superfamily enzyme YgiQ (UPF0313 family)
MKVLLVYPPFCTPASPPYSLVNLYSFLKSNSKVDLDILDLNLEFHKLKFKKYQNYFQNFNLDNYEEVSKEYHQISKKTYSENNMRVRNHESPEFMDELIEKIKQTKPDYVAFSVVYSSQVFYTLALLKNLKIKTLIGGPAVNDKLREVATKTMVNEVELLEFLTNKVNHQDLKCDYTLEFNKLNLEEYFTKVPVIPIKTSSTCFYKQCTFCTHHQNKTYIEYSLEQIKQTILKSKQKQFFFIDDMISKKRLLKLAEILTPLKITWTCQLRPTKELDKKTLETLYSSGLRMIIWGVESGNDRILELMKKGTNVNDITKVIKHSKLAGMKNVLYIMFGFPTETKEEFLDTINLLKENQENIDLISTSIFGLQKDTPIYNNPKEFKITKIIEQNRTLLGPKISYDIKQGLNQKEAETLRKSYKKTIDNLNKYPRTMNFFREHLLNVS